MIIKFKFVFRKSVILYKTKKEFNSLNRKKLFNLTLLAEIKFSIAVPLASR